MLGTNGTTREPGQNNKRNSTDVCSRLGATSRESSTDGYFQNETFDSNSQRGNFSPTEENSSSGFGDIGKILRQLRDLKKAHLEVIKQDRKYLESHLESTKQNKRYVEAQLDNIKQDKKNLESQLASNSEQKNQISEEIEELENFLLSVIEQQ